MNNNNNLKYHLLALEKCTTCVANFVVQEHIPEDINIPQNYNIIVRPQEDEYYFFTKYMLEDTDSDYFVLITNEYVPVVEDYLSILLTKFRQKFPNNIGYLCLCYLPLHGLDPHSAISTGIISQSAINILRDTNCLNAFIHNQILCPQYTFSKMFTNSYVPIDDIRDEYGVQFWVYGKNVSYSTCGKDLFLPIQVFLANQSTQTIDLQVIRWKCSETPILSILIPTLENATRKKLLQRLLDILNNQWITHIDKVEVIVLRDNKQFTVGKKRNLLLDLANGKYTTFIDDDDKVIDTFVDDILVAIEKGELSVEKGHDCIVYEDIMISIDGSELYGKYGFPPEYKHLPCHRHIWKSEISKKHRYSNMYHGEDFDWIYRAIEDIKSLGRIDKCLYIAEYNCNKSY